MEWAKRAWGTMAETPRDPGEERERARGGGGGEREGAIWGMLEMLMIGQFAYVYKVAVPYMGGQLSQGGRDH